MYAVRGSWVGQTFALATSNDSGGRKSRIRRSKEERKAMVESFIKRYQSSNEGNFPSLNLTHKEVGGSFYTVREIVREIIQENKVLGPARFNFELQQDDPIADEYPLGSISREPHLLFQTENELDVDSNHQKESSGLTVNGDGHYTINEDLNSVQYSSEAQTNEISKSSDELACRMNDDLVISTDKEHGNLESLLNSNERLPDDKETDNGQSLNKIQTNEICEESGELLVEESPVRKTLEADREVTFVGAFKAELTLPTEEVEVETFPLIPATNEVDHLGSTSADLKNINETLNHKETKQVQVNNGSPILDELISSDSPSDLVTEKPPDGSESPISDKNPSMGIGQADVTLTSNGFGVSGSSTMEDESSIIIHNHVDRLASDSDLTLNTTEQSRVDGLKPEAAPEGTSYMKNSSVTSSTNADKKSKVMDAKEIYTQQSTKGSSPTLNRINLESWARTSKQETNPLMMCLKAFMDAFVKFWS